MIIGVGFASYSVGSEPGANTALDRGMTFSAEVSEAPPHGLTATAA